MSRVRISTTVDEGLLAAGRRLVASPDSELLDHALKALIEQTEAEIERRALDAHPYEQDPDLAWEVADGPPLPYEGKVPDEVIKRARARRRR